MKKKEIIKKNYEFSKIINNNQNIKSKYYSIYYQLNNKENKYGITIPTKTGNAVIRNKIKRQIKSIVDNNKKNIKTSYEYVIIIKKTILELNYKEKEEELLKLFKKIGE